MENLSFYLKALRVVLAIVVLLFFSLDAVVYAAQRWSLLATVGLAASLLIANIVVGCALVAAQDRAFAREDERGAV